MADTRKEKMQEIMEQLEKGVADVFTSDNYIRFLNIISQFHSYSLNNCVLILSQYPSASRVASFATWKKIGCSVQKGSKGIKILVPTPKKIVKEQTAIDDDDGNAIVETIEKKALYFKVGHVFDVSQVDGEIPSLCEELKDNSEYLHNAVERIISQNSDINYDFNLKQGGANGYCRLDTKAIFLRAGMSDLQTLKTILHEKAHQLLHTSDSEKYTREEKEVQAESCAYVALQHIQSSTGIQLDSSSYTFPYVATWASGRELKELKSSLEVIKTTSEELIRWITSETDLQMAIPA